MSHDLNTSLSTPVKKVIYMALYESGQQVINKYNPCQIKDGECAAGKGRLATCCGGCEHLTPTGCGVQALTCKLYLCPTLTHKGGVGVREADAALTALFNVANKAGLMYNHYSKMRRSFNQFFWDQE